MLQGFILGLVQGLTEFLPVSSSGHLLLLETLGIGEASLFFNLALHLATLLAVFFAFRKDIVAIIKNPLGKEGLFILASTVPTAILALVIKKFFPDHTKLLPFFFVLTSVVLLLPYIIKPVPRPFTEKNCLKTSVVFGLTQGIACFSGLSRSGSTLSALSLCGVDEEQSAKLSLLASVPIIIGGAAFEGISGGAEKVDLLSLAVGFVTAFLVGLLAIRIFIKTIKKRKTWVFSIYTFLLGIASFFMLYVKL